MKHFIRFKLRNLTVAGLALIMAATFAVPFFAYPDHDTVKAKETEEYIHQSRGWCENLFD